MEYIVKASDSIERIAAVHDCTVGELMKMNRLGTRMVFPGQKLIVPLPMNDEGTFDNSSATSQLIDHAKTGNQVSVHIISNGTVTGTLIITPNALMFDPDVVHPLVMENGQDLYIVMVRLVNNIFSLRKKLIHFVDFIYHKLLQNFHANTIRGSVTWGAERMTQSAVSGTKSVAQGVVSQSKAQENILILKSMYLCVYNDCSICFILVCATSLDEMPNLFRPIHELLSTTQISSTLQKSTTVESPFYLSVHLHKKKKCDEKLSPLNEDVVVGYPARTKFWFTVPKEKVDAIYQFLLLWNPEKFVVSFGLWVFINFLSRINNVFSCDNLSDNGFMLITSIGVI
ncbi:unnamed protein product [Thelazia callipaeda]|uniref:LysM domain-containing protein n=1 Tax=Thelazia callipaeda TaxID=103827 RepID=A0A0N5D662_THECL|nr:unnamed protein product [Thelazia callipaeda]